MDYRQTLSSVAMALATTLPGLTWAQAPTAPAATQKSNAQNGDSTDRKTDKKTRRRDERAEKRAITQRQRAHRKHPPKTVTP